MSAPTGVPVLLVGGAGFIGQALAARLIGEGREVHVLSRVPPEDMPSGVHVHAGCQGEADVVAPLLTHCPEVFHLASATTPADTVWKPVAEVEANLLPALRFLECAQDVPEARLVFVSTGGALYGNAECAAESGPLFPASYHGAGKLALETFFGVLGARRPGALSILRPSNVYGPGQSLRAGFGIIRTLLERAIDAAPVTVFGDGGAVRDYLYIDDMVEACVCALHGPAGVFNVGAGVGTSLNELLAVVERVTGRRLHVERLPVRPSDAARIVLDTRAAQRRLNWSPQVSLEEGVQRAWLALFEERHF